MPTPTFFSRKPLRSVLRTLFLVATLSVSVVHADDYADVSRLMHVGQFAEALVKADQYLTGKPRDPQMRFLKGVAQTETGKTSDAIATFTKITEDYPELPEPYNNIAVLYADQKQFDKARAALELAIRTNPSYATAHENIGDIYAQLASQAYSKALQLDRGNTGVQPKLALIRTLFTVETKAQQKSAATGSQASGPVTATPPAPFGSTNDTEKEVEAAVRAWVDAWSSKNMSAYLDSYGQNFEPPGKQARKAWEDNRHARIVGKSKIYVKLSNLSVAVQGSKATVKFKQDYSADSLSISSRKTLDLAKVGDRWVIVKEFTGS